jgi:hypothetical protein
MRTPFVAMLCLTWALASCGEKSSGADPGKSGASQAATSSTGAPSTGATSAATGAAAPAKGSVAELEAKARGVLDALKKGDVKAAADFCLGKHRDGLEKYIVEKLGQKEQSRAKAFAAWDGKLGEVRVDGDDARVAYGRDGGHVDYLSFRKKDGEWSLFDFPVASEDKWKTWGAPAK